MFFVIPEMPSKAFVMVLKKLPDRFKQSELYGRVVDLEEEHDYLLELQEEHSRSSEPLSL